MNREFLKRIWILPVLVAILAAAHGVALYRFASRLTGGAVLGLVMLVLLTHSGILGSVLFRLCDFLASFQA